MHISTHILNLPYVVKLCQTSLSWFFIITYLFTSVGGATLIKEAGHQVAHILQDYASTSYHTHTHSQKHEHSHLHHHTRKQTLTHTHTETHHHGGWLTILSEIAQNETESDPEQLTLTWKDLIPFPLNKNEYQFLDLRGGKSPINYPLGIQEVYLLILTPPPQYT